MITIEEEGHDIVLITEWPVQILLISPSYFPELGNMTDGPEYFAAHYNADYVFVKDPESPFTKFVEIHPNSFGKHTRYKGIIMEGLEKRHNKQLAESEEVLYG